jgi:hypothetical protein
MSKNDPAVIPAADERTSFQFGVASVDPDGPPPKGPDAWTRVYRLTVEQGAEVLTAWEEAVLAIGEMPPDEWFRLDRAFASKDVAEAVSELVSITPSGHIAVSVRALTDEMLAEIAS